MRTTTLITGLAAAGLVLAACGGSDPSDAAIEEILENAAGGDADVDLSDGEIRVQTEEGEVVIDVDPEDGSFEMSVDGEEVIDAQVDEDGEGEVNIETEDGDGSLDVSTGTGEIPDDWPSDIPTPEGLAIEGSSSFSSGEDSTVTVTGTATEEWVEGYGAAVESAGFTEATRMSSEDSLNLFYEQGEWFVTIFAADSGDGSWDVVLSASQVAE